jgi:hypothetical protein
MMKPEARFYQTLKTRFLLPADRMDRIENSFGEGLPDTNMCLSGEDIWCELKAPTEPKRATTKLMTSNNNHRLLDSQINWFIRQRQSGGIGFILLRTDKRIMLIDGSIHAKEVNDWTVQQMATNAIYVCMLPMPAHEWSMLRHVIFTSSRHHRLHRHASAQKLLDDMERQKLADHRQSR